MAGSFRGSVFVLLGICIKGILYADCEFSATCSGANIAAIQCPASHTIHITQAYAAYAGASSCATYQPSVYECTADLEGNAAAFYQSLIMACEQKTSCDNSLSATAVTLATCGSLTNIQTDTVVIEYQCVSDILYQSACTGQSLNSVRCPAGFIIKVVSAYYGDPPGVLSLPNCQNVANTGGNTSCMVEVNFKSPLYYQEILTKCDSQQACQDLVAARGDVGYCYQNEYPDFVRIYYQCIGGVPPSTVMNTDSTTESSQTPTSSEPVSTSAPSDSLDTGLIVGSTVGGALGVTFIGVLIAILRNLTKKGKSGDKSGDKGQSTNNPFDTFSPKSMQNDVAPNPEGQTQIPGDNFLGNLNLDQITEPNLNQFSQQIMDQIPGGENFPKQLQPTGQANGIYY